MAAVDAGRQSGGTGSDPVPAPGRREPSPVHGAPWDWGRRRPGDLWSRGGRSFLGVHGPRRRGTAQPLGDLTQGARSNRSWFGCLGGLAGERLNGLADPRQRRGWRSGVSWRRRRRWRGRLRSRCLRGLGDGRQGFDGRLPWRGQVTQGLRLPTGLPVQKLKAPFQSLQPQLDPPVLPLPLGTVPEQQSDQGAEPVEDQNCQEPQHSETIRGTDLLFLKRSACHG